LDQELTNANQTNTSKIFEAAKVLFSRFGFRKTTVDELAEYAGIAKSTMYRVFESKEKILAELIIHEAQTFRRFYIKRIREVDGPLEKIEALCCWTSDYFNKFPFLGRVMTDDERFFSPFLGSELDFVENGIRELIRDLLEEGTASGVFRPMNITDATEAILTLMHKFAYHQYTDEEENSEWVKFVTHSIWAIPPDNGGGSESQNP
jgi:AcrR family transcriptional regulator